MSIGASLITAAANLALSPVVKTIIDKIKSSLEQTLSKTLEGKLTALSRELEVIHGKLLRVERPVTLEKRWRQRIREVNSDVEDLLDIIEFEERRSKVHNLLSNLPDPDIIGEIKKKLDDIHETLLELMAKSVAHEKWTEETISVFAGEKFIGRKDEIDKIVAFLLSENNNDNNNTCSIVGIGGVGKTALAQVICQHKRVNEKLVVKWAHVGFKKFDLREILLQIGGKIEKNNSLETQIRILEESLGTETRYLFVLDDFWDISQVDWKRLKSTLLNINKGNKFLITTRNQRIAEIAAGKDKTVFLKPLEPAECLPLIKMHVKSYDLLSPIIKEEMIEECEGVPLAAITLGRKLSKKTSRVCDIWSTEDVEKNGNIMNSLKFSYDYLPPHLKDCLAYHAVCNDILHKEKLTQMWTAQGFIKEPDDGNTAFKDLQNASFFHDVEEHIFPGTPFKVLKLFRTLIFLVSKEYADTTVSEITGVTRHVSLSPQRHAQEPQESRMLGQLRTVVGLPEIKLLSQFRGLRVLVLCGVEFESSAISLGNLKHLRYLDLSKNGSLKELPESLGELLFLKTLRVDQCNNLKELRPNEINKLTNLGHLYASSLQASLEFEGLSSLQTLHLKNFQNLEKLPEMSYFTRLETLEILDCPLLRFKEDDMKDLKNLRRLAMIKLPRLETVPVSSGLKLKSMRLSNSKNLTILTEGFRSLTSLESLTIEDCPRLESSLSTVDGQNILPDNLKSLRMKRSAELTEIYKRGEGCDDVSWIKEVYRNGVLINPVPNVEPSPSSSAAGTGVLTEGSNTEVEEPARENSDSKSTRIQEGENGSNN